MQTVSVYTTNNNGVDFSDAERFVHNGGVYHITEGTQNIFNVESLCRLIDSQIDQMNPQDYLLITGNSFLAGLVMACAYNRFQRLNVLVWDHRVKQYADKVVEFS